MGDARKSVRVGDRGRRQLGRSAEEIACRHLRRLDWQILNRNWRIRMGEIDIVALDAKTVVFVEVKAGRMDSRGPGPQRPVLAVGPAKQTRLRRLAEAWFAHRGGCTYPDLRFDVVGITFDGEGRPASLEHMRAAF